MAKANAPYLVDRSDADDSLYELLADAGPDELPNRFLLVLRAYLDSSGAFPRDAGFTLSGYLSPVRRWSGFDRAWRDALRRGKRIEVFKCTDAEHFTGEFRGWTQDEVDVKVADLCCEIRHRAEAFCLFAIPWETYKPTWDRCPRRLRDPFYVTFGGMLKYLPGLLDRLKYPDSPRVDIVMDVHGERIVNARAESLYASEIEAARRKWLNRIIPSTDDVDLALQAADIVAYKSRRYGCGIDAPVEPSRFKDLEWAEGMRVILGQSEFDYHEHLAGARSDLW